MEASSMVVRSSSTRPAGQGLHRPLTAGSIWACSRWVAGARNYRALQPPRVLPDALASSPALGWAEEPTKPMGVAAVPVVGRRNLQTRARVVVGGSVGGYLPKVANLDCGVSLPVCPLCGIGGMTCQGVAATIAHAVSYVASTQSRGSGRGSGKGGPQVASGVGTGVAMTTAGRGK